MNKLHYIFDGTSLCHLILQNLYLIGNSFASFVFFASFLFPSVSRMIGGKISPTAPQSNPVTGDNLPNVAGKSLKNLSLAALTTTGFDLAKYSFISAENVVPTLMLVLQWTSRPLFHPRCGTFKLISVQKGHMWQQQFPKKGKNIKKGKKFF